MKIKTSFVTNSSTTSFVVIGAYLDRDSIPTDRLQGIAKEEDIDLLEVQDAPFEYIEKLLRNSDLSYSFGPDYDEDQTMVGMCYTKMGEDETLRQFKDRVHKEILAKFGISVTPFHIEEAWRDG